MNRTEKVRQNRKTRWTNTQLGRLTAVFLLLPMILMLSACQADNKTRKEMQNSSKTEFFAMDTYITITVYGENAEKGLSLAKDRFSELEKLWSVTDENSEIYAVNHANGQPVTVSKDTADILAFTLDMAGRTNGALEATIYPVLTAWGFTTGKNQIPPDEKIKELLNEVGYSKVHQNGNTVQLPDGMMLDLGAVGKGYAGDVITELMKENGITSALLDIGGNIQAIGAKPDGNDWRLGIRDPFGEGNVGVLNVCDAAVVTSGSYERYFVGEDGKQYGHILDPATGYPAESGLMSVAVIAKEGKLCDALSTSLFVMGLDEATDYWRQNGGFEMIFITESGEIYLTEGVESSFALDSYHSNMKVHVIDYEK